MKHKRFWKYQTSLPLPSQEQSKPYARSVEKRRNHFIHDPPGITRGERSQRSPMVAEGVHVEEPRRRNQKCEHVTQCHRHQHRVRWRAHVPLQHTTKQIVLVINLSYNKEKIKESAICLV